MPTADLLTHTYSIVQPGIQIGVNIIHYTLPLVPMSSVRQSLAKMSSLNYQTLEYEHAPGEVSGQQQQHNGDTGKIY